MTVRTPLKIVSGNLQEMSTTDIDNIKAQVLYLYGTDPSVTLSQVASGGTLDAINDTRLQAGAMVTRAGDGSPVDGGAAEFFPAAETPDISTVTVAYDRITQANVDTTETADTNSLAFPVFNNSGNIQSMTLTDMYDTFIYPQIDILIDGADRPGTFKIHTATTLSGNTIVSSTPVFSDTRADVSAYTAAGIGEDEDQPTTVTNYYLFKTDAGSATAYSKPLYVRNADKNLQEYTTAESDAILLNCIRHVASEVAGNTIRYRVNGDGNNKGSGMVNTVLNGTGNYQTHEAGADDYRSQKFPDGSVSTQATHFLKIYKV
jgi:hypothetical protein